MQTGGCRRSPLRCFCVPPDPAPIPVAAHWHGPTQQLRVMFSGPLVPGMYNSASWSWRQSDYRWRGATATVLVVAPHIVRVESLLVGADAGPNVCSYDPLPIKLIGANGHLVEAFAGYPIT